MRVERSGRLALLILLLAACGGGPPTSEGVVIARVGEATVRYRDFRAFLEETGDTDTELGSEVLSALLDQFLLEEQLRRLAVDRRLVPASASRRDALAALLSGEAAATAVTAAEVTEYYEAHVGEFVRPERVRLRQILVEDRATAETALAELTAGGDFTEVASRLSVDPSAPFGGDQGELARDDLPESFAATIFALTPGEASGILEAAYGFHIFQVVERLPAAQIPAATASAQITEILNTRAADRRRATLVAEAAERYNVMLERRNLPFTYVEAGARGADGADPTDDEPEVP